MVVSGHALADGTLHESRERRKDIDGREDLSVVQLTVDVDLQWPRSGEPGSGSKVVVRSQIRGATAMVLPHVCVCVCVCVCVFMNIVCVFRNKQGRREGEIRQ